MKMYQKLITLLLIPVLLIPGLAGAEILKQTNGETGYIAVGGSCI